MENADMIYLSVEREITSLSGLTYLAKAYDFEDDKEPCVGREIMLEIYRNGHRIGFRRFGTKQRPSVKVIDEVIRLEIERYEQLSIDPMTKDFESSGWKVVRQTMKEKVDEIVSRGKSN